MKPLLMLSLIVVTAYIFGCTPDFSVSDTNKESDTLDDEGNNGTDSHSDADTGSDSGGDAESDTDANFDSESNTETEVAMVYAHSATVLYEIDPIDLTVSEVGNFQFSKPGDQMTDIALDAEGNMMGITYTNIYAVNKETAECQFLATLVGSTGFNGLSFLEDKEGNPFLVGAENNSGRVYKIDPQTGAETQLGEYGNGLKSSGDLVYVQGAGAFATAKMPGNATDVLISVDPHTGAGTFIGDTGFTNIYGLAYWGGKLYGFTSQGEFVSIDPETGAGSLIEATEYSFWGAGVITTAPTTVI